MTEWIAGSFRETITTVNTSATALQLFANTQQPFLTRTIVDGFVTILTNTDELIRVDMFGPLPAWVAAADLVFSNARNRSENWYRFYGGRGPMVFRTRSKRSFGAEEELWALVSKEEGLGVEAEIMVGWQFLLSP